jgi:hypothetical protein
MESNVSTDQNSLLGWAIAGVTSVVSTLLGGLLAIFRLREGENSKRIEALETSVVEITEKADTCEEERGELRSKCAVLEFKVEQLENRMRTE